MQKHTPQKIGQVLKRAIKDFSNYKISKKSAALAYYTIFSLPGMLIVIITVLDTLYGQAAIDGAFQNKIRDAVGDQLATQIQNIISNAAISGQASIATIIGILVLIYGATKMFSEMQDSINLIWDIEPKPKKGWVKLVVNRVISFLLVIALGLLLLASFILSGVITVIGDYLAQYFPEVTVILLTIINLALSFFIVFALFAILFKVLPDVHIRWRDVSVGAFVTTLLFIIGKILISIYLTQGNVGSIYGTASSIILILLWVFYSAMLLYFGVAFTKEYANVFGKEIYPSQAVWKKKVTLDDSHSLQSIEHATIEGLIKPEEPNEDAIEK